MENQSLARNFLYVVVSFPFRLEVFKKFVFIYGSESFDLVCYGSYKRVSVFVW